MLIGLLAHRLIMFHVKRETVTLVVGAILAVVTRPINSIGNLSFLDATEHSVGLLDAIGAAGDPSLSFVPDSTAHAMRNSARNSSARARPGGFYGWSLKGISKSGHLSVTQADIKQVEDFALYSGKQTLSTELANGAKFQPGDSGGPVMTDGRDSVLLLPQKSIKNDPVKPGHREQRV